MFSIMYCSMLLGKLFLTLSISLLNRSVAGSSAPLLGYDGDERDALYALRDAFNDPYLNNNWTSIHCHMDDPPRWYGIQCKNGRVTGIVLEGMELKGMISFNALVRFSELSILSLKNNALQGRIMDFSGNQKLAQVDLSGNRFHGPISESLLSLALLASLQLQNNNLTGEIPAFKQSTLISFNVSNNYVSGPIPSTQSFQLFGWESYLGNPGLCGLPSHNSCDNSSPSSPNPSGSADNDTEKSKNPSKSDFRILSLLFSVGALLAGSSLCILCYKKAKNLIQFMNRENNTEEEAAVQKKEKSEAVRSGGAVEKKEDRGKLIFLENGGGFEMTDLLKASPEEIGKGIFGNTYKATLDDGQALVVKILKDLKPMTGKKFTRQLQLLADQKHPNLNPPLACFFSKQRKLLICRYAAKGNLFNRIHGGRGSRERVLFRWNSRLSAARGVAHGLHYLHINSKSRPNVTVPHGNLKSTNVLLDQDDTVLVSDYGLYSLILSHIAVKSAVCFKSPEYQAAGMTSPKTDVWSYGCLLLELLTGQVYANAAPPGFNGVDLCSWVHRAVREEWTAEIFDSEIRKERRLEDGMVELLQIAMRCCDESPDKRPEMVEIVQEIENIKVADDCEDDFLTSLDDILQSSR